MSEAIPEGLAEALNRANSEEPAAQPPAAENPSTGYNPAYDEILGQIPEALREPIIPALKKWDENFNSKLSQVQSQYAHLNDFKDRNADDIRTGLDLVNFLNTNPEEFYKNLQQHYGFDKGGSGQGQQGAQEFDLSEDDDPRLKALQQGQEQTLAQLNRMQEMQAQKEAEEWLSNKQAAITETLKGKGLDPDFEYIVNVAQQIGAKNGGNFDKAMDQAAQQFETMVSRYRTAPPVAAQTPTAPPVLAPSGSVPAQQFDPAKLSDADRRQLFIQALNAANKE